MSQDRVLGYNIALKINGKTCIGRTQEDLSVSPTVKESITKDDAGAKKFSVTGHEVTFSVNGLMEYDGAAGTTKLDNNDLLAQSLKKGTEAEVPCVYDRGSGQSYQGTAIMTRYSESTNSEDEGTYTAEFRITGEFSPVTGNNG